MLETMSWRSRISVSSIAWCGIGSDDGSPDDVLGTHILLPECISLVAAAAAWDDDGTGVGGDFVAEQ